MDKETKFKDGAYAKNDPVYLGTSEYGHPKESFKRIGEMIYATYGRTPLSLIDVGCATGAFIMYAKKVLNLTQVVGVDVSDSHIKQAMKYVHDAEFIVDSLLAPRRLKRMSFDVCTCLGTLSIFDDFERALRNLCALVKGAGAIYIYDIVNDHPVDVMMRYRVVGRNGHSQWKAAFNVRSLSTYRDVIKKMGRGVRMKAVDFVMPFPIVRRRDPMRAWTIKTEHNPNQVVVGTGQMLNLKIIQITK